VSDRVHQAKHQNKDAHKLVKLDEIVGRNVASDERVSQPRDQPSHYEQQNDSAVEIEQNAAHSGHFNCIIDATIQSTLYQRQNNVQNQVDQNDYKKGQVVSVKRLASVFGVL
jgi:hypothetical protein